MRNFLTQHAAELHQGGIRMFFDAARQYKNVINLGIGEPDFDTPDEIIQESCRCMELGATHYTANAGDLSVRRAVELYLKKYDVYYDAETQIIMTCGGMGAVSMSLLCTVSAGDEVLVPDPAWLNYISQINFIGATAVPVPTYEEDAFALTPENIERLITPRSKVLIINCPCNPTGATMTKMQLEAIAEIAQKHDLLVISDEVYCELLYDDQKHISIASLPNMRERTIVINSFSKSFAMTGWRLGFAAGPEAIISKMIVLQENLISCAPAPSQAAGKFALETMCGLEEMRKTYEVRRNLMVDSINRIEGLSCLNPSGAFYVFANIKETGMRSYEFAMGLLQEEQVVAVPGSAFGQCGEGYIRLAYANSYENIEAAMTKLNAYVLRHK